MVGRVGLYSNTNARPSEHWKSDGLDLTAHSVTCPAVKPRADVERSTVTIGPESSAWSWRSTTGDHPTAAQCENARSISRRSTKLEMPIVNTNRTVGTMLSHEYGQAVSARTGYCRTRRFTSGWSMDRRAKASVPSWPMAVYARSWKATPTITWARGCPVVKIVDRTRLGKARSPPRTTSW